MNKQELRKYIREQKRCFTQQQLREASCLIMDRLLQHDRVKQTDTILFYHSLPDEVCTHDVCDELVRMGKTVLLPRVISDCEMTIHKYSSNKDMKAGSLGILEPCTPEFTLTPDIHLTGIIPGMAFDMEGHRLGRGKGYYDRFLSSHPYIYKIGVCFPFQILDEIPCESTDVKMDEVFTSTL